MNISNTGRTPETIEAIRERALRRIDESHVAGCNTRHNRQANMQAIRSVLEGDPHYTWDIRGVERFSFDEILGAIAAITGCSSDPDETIGGGFIAPAATLRGLEEAAAMIAATARRGGRFLLGTGHPGSLLLFYIRLADLIRSWGGVVLEPAHGAQAPPNLELAYFNGVAVTTDRASVPHSHGHDAMDQMLAGAGHVDLAIADHGYASGAIAAGLPVIAVMDTNDPALALAKALGAEVTIVPMDDNRPPDCYLPVLESIRELGEHHEPDLVARPPETSPGLPAPLEPERLAAAERLVLERGGPSHGVDELVTGLLSGFRDQFLQTGLDPDEREQWSADPHLELAVHRRFHDALHDAARRRLLVADPEIDTTRIDRYLDSGVVDARDTPQ